MARGRKLIGQDIEDIIEDGGWFAEEDGVERQLFFYAVPFTKTENSEGEKCSQVKRLLVHCAVLDEDALSWMYSEQQESVAAFVGTKWEELSLIGKFDAVASYFSPMELDSYPEEMSPKEFRKRYAKRLK